MAQINFPTATSNGQTFEADNGVIYTYVGTPPNGFWSGSFQATGLTTLDARFLKLDSSNDPVTGGLNITGGNVGIGTSTPTSQLQVVSTVSDTTTEELTLSVGAKGTSSSVRQLNLYAPGPSSDRVAKIAVENTAAPFAIDVNSAERLRITTGGNVGIGTSSPSAALHLSASNSGQLLRLSHTDVASYYSFGRDASGNLRISDSTNGELIRVQPNGNVGIGTSNPEEKLHIKGGNSAIGSNWSNANNLIRIEDTDTSQSNGQVTGGIIFEGNDSDAPGIQAGIIAQSGSGTGGGDIAFHTAASGTTLDGTESARMVIDSSGNVGIGTTNPLSTLHLLEDSPELIIDKGTAVNTAGGNEKVVKITAKGQKNGVAGPCGSIIFRQDDSTWSSVNQNHKPTRIELCTQDAGTTDQSEVPRLVVDRDGNVGIGTTNPGAPLEVQTASGERILFDSAGSSQQPRIQLIRDGGSDYSIQNAIGIFEIQKNSDDIYRYASDIHQFFTAGSGERMRIASNGFVGIGASNPSRNLVVNNSTGNTFISVKGSNTGIVGLLLGDQSADNVGQISYSNNLNSMQFLTAASEKMRITSGGNVGIGTNNPGSRLQIGSSTANSSNVITFGKRVTSSQTNMPKIGHTSDGTNSDLGICATSGGGSIRFFTGNGDAGFGASSNAERMRILSDGSMMFGQMVTVSPGNGNTSTGIGFSKSTSGVRLHLNMSGTTGLFVGRNNNGTCTDFRRAGVQVGRVIINTSSVSYSTSSDYRLKENVVVLDNAIDRVKQLLPKRFNFINDSLTLDGFLAHEAQTVVPEAVDGSYNETEPIGTLTEWDGTVLETDVAEPDDLTWEDTVTDEDGNESTETRTRTWTQTGTQPVYQSIDQAKLVPLLTAALQEAIAKIETLDQRLTDAGIE